MGARKPKPARRVPLRAHHPEPPADATEARTSVYAMIHRGAAAIRDRDGAGFERALDDLTTAPADLVDTSITEISEHILATLWKRGWQPVDVVRMISGPEHGGWLRDRMAAEIGHYPVDRIHDRWTAQLRELGVERRSDGDEYLTGWGSHRSEALRVVLEVIGGITYLPDLPLLMPPPGVARRGTMSPDARAADSRMLGKIRLLLAKAESTKFPAEAESYSAKAQELMARHTIDHALLDAPDDDQAAPVGVRITIEAPYAQAKAILLQEVAAANMCRAVWSPDLGFSTVFGWASDLDVVEMLNLSLLVQGSAAMIREGSASKESRARTREFRESFLQAYASRIGERLSEVAASAKARAADDDARLLPVLAGREKAVDERMQAMFPVSSSGTIRIRDERGWVSGRAAADRVSFDH